MNILAINCGSTSLKFRLVQVDGHLPGAEQRRLAEGVVNSIGPSAEVNFSTEAGAELRETRALGTLGEAATTLIRWLGDSGLPSIDAAGHRIVHGGARFDGPIVISSNVTRALEELEELAPLHNGPALEAMKAVSARLGPTIPAVATFDTTFHRTMPPRAALYALPLDLMERHGIRRYGFHGLAHRSMVERYAALTSHPIDRVRLITLQLGGGCSIAAVDGGRSVDTSMGFTPLEGLMMATRSGDLDPSLPAYLGKREQMSPTAVDHLLNSQSGLLGVSGRSEDVRELLAAESEGDRRAALALEMFCYRIRKAIGAQLAALGGAEAIVFGGGIGEHQPPIRARSCAGLEWFGLTIDPDRNAAASGGVAQISTEASRLHAWVIPSDEESMIVSDTLDCLRK